MKRRIFYLLRDVICSILITVFIVYGGYWLTFHTGDQGYTGLRFSIITAPVMFITTMSAITFAVLFFVNRYFNRFMTILCCTLMVGAQWGEIIVEQINSWNAYLDSGLLFFVFTGLVSLVALATGKIIARISAQAKNPPTTPPRQ